MSRQPVKPALLQRPKINTAAASSHGGKTEETRTWEKWEAVEETETENIKFCKTSKNLRAV